MSFEKLLSPITIRDLTLPNRVVMSAMGTHEAGESEDGKSVTDKLIEYFVARVKGGCGLVTVEVTAVDEASSPKGFLSIANDKYIEGLKKLNDAIHDAGGKSCVQLWQGGLAVASDPMAQILLPNDTPLAPNYTVPGITKERLLSVVEAFGQGARRAKEAGFDSVEFHCAHNYLPHSMLSGAFNYRQDEFGGSFENRKKFPLMCIKAIRDNIPEGMPLFMRVDCHDDMMPNGLTVEEVIDFCKDAGKAGVDVLNVSRGNIMSAATVYEVAPVEIPNGFNVADAARIRKETGMLTMPCGRINYPDLAEEILEDDKADLVVMARAQLADPQFVNKIKAGKLNSIRYCLGCNQGCYDYFVKSLEDPSYKHISCMRNPALLEEATMSLTPAATSKKVLVVGGGIAGLEAAIDLKETGNEPVIYEESGKLGGQFGLAGIAPGKADFAKGLQNYINYVTELGIEVHLNSRVTAETVKEVKPDVVIIANGSSPVTLNIAGKERTVQAHDVLKGAEVNGDNVVVIGGGLVGFETAEVLAAKGKKATVLEMKPAMFTDLGPLRMITANFALAQMPITTVTDALVTEVTATGVKATVKGEEKEFAADTVIMAVGSKSNSSGELVEACKELGVDYYLCGDGKKTPGVALDAIHDAYKAVLAINAK